jgi:cysteine desulfurase
VLVERLPVRMDGQVDPAALADLEVDERTLVSVQWVNNETGVIQPVGDLAERTKARGGYFHCDAAQAVGKLLFEYQKQSFDYLTLTAHKIHGPQGVGALIRRSRAPLWSRSLGGTQESGLRGGTENTPGIAGFGAAAAIRFGSLRPAIAHCRTLRDYFEAEVRARLPGVQFLGNPLQRVGALTSLRLPGVDGQALVAQLDAQGVFVSQSSACTNMRPEPSYVLRAMGLTEDEAYESIRVAFSVESRVDEVMKAVQIISEIGLALGAPGVPTGGRSESGE